MDEDKAQILYAILSDMARDVCTKFFEEEERERMNYEMNLTAKYFDLMKRIDELEDKVNGIRNDR